MNINFFEEKYLAEFEPNTGKIISIGPAEILKTRKNTVAVDNDLAQRINNKEISLHSCFLDIEAKDVKIAQSRNLFKIDDVLHRIPLRKYSKIEDPDVIINYNKDSRNITVSLNYKWGGTYGAVTEYMPSIIWSGDNVLQFLVTAKNDPNILLEIFNFTVEQLQKESCVYQLKNNNQEFSIFTKRIFKKYVIDIDEDS